MNRRLSTVLLHVALTLGLVVMAVPFVWMILGSFKTTGELRQMPPTWIPEEPTTQSYRDLFDRSRFECRRRDRSLIVHASGQRERSTQYGQAAEMGLGPHVRIRAEKSEPN